VQSLGNLAACNAVTEMGGRQALILPEVAARFEELDGHLFTVTHVPGKTLQEQKRAATDLLRQSFAGLILALAAAPRYSITSHLRRLALEAGARAARHVSLNT
jgi:hypothetical protein